MSRLAPIAVILSVLAGPSFAGGIFLDLPSLTFPLDDGVATVGTKSVGKP